MAATGWTKLKGRFVREIGHLLGDRHTEAKGEVEEALGRDADADALERVERSIRRSHHDIPDPLVSEEEERARAMEREPGYGPSRRERKR